MQNSRELEPLFAKPSDNHMGAEKESRVEQEEGLSEDGRDCLTGGCS